MGRVTDSDRTCTAGQARRALEKARARGLEGWSRTNGSLTREQSFDIFWRCVKDKPPDGPITGHRARGLGSTGNGLIAKNLREEFGVNGEKPGLKKPWRPRKRKSPDRWPEAPDA